MQTHVLAASAGPATAGLLLLIAVLGGGLAAVAVYESVKRKGFRPRHLTTTLPVERVRELFLATVSGTGWSIVDEGNPVVAQSDPRSGVRQQIALHLEKSNRGTEARIAVIRYSRTAIAGTTRAHTLRLRMNAFVAAVRRADDAAAIAG